MSETLIDVIISKKKDKYLKEYADRLTEKYSDKIEATLNKKEFENVLISDPNKALVKAYSSILKGSSDNLGELGRDLHDRLQKEGYDAVPDLNDVSEHYNTPLFIFDRSGILDLKSQMDVIDAGIFEDGADPFTINEKYLLEYLN